MKSNLHNVFKTDAAIEEQGIWFEVAPEVKFRIKRFGGFNSTAIQQNTTSPMQSKLKLA
jgi:hypothetical protein